MHEAEALTWGKVPVRSGWQGGLSPHRGPMGVGGGGGQTHNTTLGGGSDKRKVSGRRPLSNRRVGLQQGQGLLDL